MVNKITIALNVEFWLPLHLLTALNLHNLVFLVVELGYGKDLHVKVLTIKSYVESNTKLLNLFDIKIAMQYGSYIALKKIYKPHSLVAEQHGKIYTSICMQYEVKHFLTSVGYFQECNLLMDQTVKCKPTLLVLHFLIYPYDILLGQIQ